MAKRKITRCHFYNHDGTPIRHARGLGCTRGIDVCFFAHPSEADWATASPPALLYQDNRGPSNRGRRSPSPRRQYSPVPRPRRDSSLERRREPIRDSRSPPRYRRDSFGQPPRDRSPQPSAPFDSRYRDRSPRPRNNSPRPNRVPPADINMPPPPPTGPRPLKDAPGSLRSPIPFSKPPHVRPTESTSPSTPFPPPPSTRPPLVPPPPAWPPVFDASTSQSADPIAEEMTAEEKRQKWTERVSLLSQVIKERGNYSQLETNAHTLRRLVASQRFESFSNEDKADTRVQLQHAEARSREKKQTVDALITRLAEAGFWPIVAPYDTQAFETKYNDMKETMLGLRDGVAELQNSIMAVTMQYIQRQQPQLAAGLSTQPEAGTSDRPRKRPRLFETVDMSVDIQPSEPVDANLQQVITQMQDRLSIIDASLADIHNDLTQHVQNVMDEFDSKLDGKVDELIERPISAEAGGESLQRLEKAEEEVKTVGSEMDEISQELVSLITDFGSGSRERDRLEAENRALQDKVAKLEQDGRSNREALQQISKENAALSKALAIRLAGPTHQDPPAAEALFQRIEQPVRLRIREEVAPLLKELQENINQTLSKCMQEVQGPLFDRLSQSLHAAKTISEWIERDGQGALSTMPPPNNPHR
ncbi:hypothetical protein DENSPDRAFT_837090 [Dentipellis sp. KUC8613]|nr:hypothetical protein DENSPDRAFT_837090 [Dentipellis sp. KUC8613]